MAQLISVTGITKNDKTNTGTYLFCAGKIAELVQSGTDTLVFYNEKSGKIARWLVDETYASLTALRDNYDAGKSIPLTVIKKSGTVIDSITYDLSIDKIVYVFADSSDATKSYIMYDDDSKMQWTKYRVSHTVAAILALANAADDFIIEDIACDSIKVKDDTTAAYSLYFKSDSDGTALTADRSFTVDVNNADRILDLNENFTIGDGHNITITAEDADGSIVLDEQTVEFEGEGTVTRLMKFINSANAAATLTFQGTSLALVGGTNTFSITAGTSSLDIAAGITLDIDANLSCTATCVLDQDLQTTADVDFNTIGLTPDADIAAVVITGTNIEAAHVFDLNGIALTTGSIIDISAITTKTSGYLYNGSMTTSVLDASTLLDDFSVSCDHDGLAADTLRMIRRLWSGDLPNGTGDATLSIFESGFSGTMGSGGAEGGTLYIYEASLSSATLNGSNITAAGFYANVSGITNTSSDTIYGIHAVSDSSANATICAQSVDAGAVGAVISLYHNSASPAHEDSIGRIDFRGDDDAATENLQYAYIDGIIVDDATGAIFGGVEVFADNGTGTPARIVRFEHDGGHAITTFGTTTNGALLVDAVTIGDGLSSSYYNIKTIKYSIADPTNSGGDYQASSAANKTEQNFQLGAGDIIPGLCRIIDITVVCTEKWVGSVGDEVMNTDIGTASSGQQYLAAGNIDDITDINSFAIDSGLHVKTIIADSSVYVGLTPATNDWDEMTDGVTEIYITYIDNTAVV